MSFPSNKYEAAAWEYAKRQTAVDASARELLDAYNKAAKELYDQFKSEEHDDKFYAQFFRDR